ncbi:hypothetical protein [Xylophilus sp.]|uniref:hypothetical protein n=1 Tax=Xylophilus sp. TaxID=2653893 RepID=UPI0013BC5D1E|nr:hypothetical protein [Xylophilus sp.]KAF1041781.1 MAG: hypothetical protein GAK38_04504 [Xylophilus sp.]
MGLSTIAPYLMIGSSVLGAAGSNSQGQQQGALADAQAQQLTNQAAGERDAALASAQRIRRAGVSQRAQANAAYAAAGVSLDRGTPVRVTDQIDLDAETDAYTAILEGDRRARTLDYEAKAARQAGKNARSAGGVGVRRSVLGGAAGNGMWGGGAASPLSVSSLFTGGGSALGSTAGMNILSGGLVK